MIKNYTTYRILQLFFDCPTKSFHLREICRLTKLGMPSVRNHVKKLEKWGFIMRKKSGVYEGYISDRSEMFKIYKRNDMLIRLKESGLIEFLVETFIPDAVVLFGSAARGEDIESSDIDLLLIAKEKEVDLKRFKKDLKRNISLHFEGKVSYIPKELLNNIINGIVVYGYLRVFE
ncbi:MAG: nucleotidyltransferase domain-containing protein [Candidatus Aenigmarchaeota archaeon]|nr:nucleotidyltransferase domain-containing protein [Candidatus Aenigmarchaeota archaeon]